MTAPSPFELSRSIGTNLAGAFQESQDTNAIDRILKEASESRDPTMLQGSISKILSQVSPERQPLALQFLQNRMQNIEKQRSEQTERKAAQQAGYTYGVPPQVAAQQLKDTAKQQRISQYGLGGGLNVPSNLPNAENGNLPSPGQSIFKRLSDDQLTVLTGSPDKEVSEPAKSELKNRQEERNLEQKEKEGWTKFGMERAKKVLDKSEEIAEMLPQKQTALGLMVDSIAKKNLGFWSWDNLAEITGIEAFRSPEGALFKTAAKEYFLGSIARAGARPNQWIEQQISDMLTKIGRSTEANLSVARALKNELDIERERVRLTNEIFNELRSKGEDIGQLGPELNKRLSKYAEQKQIEIFNDLRAIKTIAEGKPQKFLQVSPGTEISPYMVDALLNTYDNDPDKALKEAKKLGYSIE